jgi:Protein of unknown function (DUF3499)
MSERPSRVTGKHRESEPGPSGRGSGQEARRSPIGPLRQQHEREASHRACSRPDCGETATATFTYDYQARTSSLELLAAESHPMSYDLCGAHADTLTAPRGWRLEDRRRQVRPTPYGEWLAS